LRHIAAIAAGKACEQKRDIAPISFQQKHSRHPRGMARHVHL